MNTEYDFKVGDKVALTDTRPSDIYCRPVGSHLVEHDGVLRNSEGVIVSAHPISRTVSVQFSGHITSVFRWRLKAVTEKAAPVQPTAKMTASVLELLQQKGSLTSLEAQGVLRCRSLSKRISELKRLGWSITRELKEDTTGQRYARYSLATA